MSQPAADRDVTRDAQPYFQKSRLPLSRASCIERGICFSVYISMRDHVILTIRYSTFSHEFRESRDDSNERVKTRRAAV